MTHNNKKFDVFIYNNLSPIKDLARVLCSLRPEFSAYYWDSIYKNHTMKKPDVSSVYSKLWYWISPQAEF